MSPANGNDVEIAVLVDIDGDRAVVVFISRVNDMRQPGLAVALVLEHIQLRGQWLFEVVFAQYDILVAVAIHIGHVHAQRPDHFGNQVLGPRHRGGFRLLIPEDFSGQADMLLAHNDIEPPIAINIRQAAPVRLKVASQRVQAPGWSVATCGPLCSE